MFTSASRPNRLILPRIKSEMRGCVTPAHSKPVPESSFWPQAAVANLLDEIASDALDHGMEIERFNMRGVHWRGIGEGGGQERALAATYRCWAEQTSSPRTTEILERIARGWDAHADREDIRAEQELLKH